MAKRPTLEDRLAELDQAAARLPTPEAIGVVQNALGAASGFLSGKAARVVREHALHALVPDLAAAFARFLEQPVKRDPGCYAKIAIIEALDELEGGTPDLFAQGARHRQLEPVWGGRVDTAANLRANCARALARTGTADAACLLTDLLMDPEPNPRQAAAAALAYLGGEAAALVLRLKVLAGDTAPEVLGECFTGLLRLAPETSLSLVTARLTPDQPDLAREAALALGESRLAAAFPLLRERWEACLDAEFRELLIVPVALTRREEAFAFLLDLIREGAPRHALAAVRAARVFDDQGARRQRLADAVAERADAAVSSSFADEFPAASVR